ncbi:MAG: O-methyltransferase [Lachnospiraceae bacterium]|nr:O-methyltransferase [Lachnospiraceae bacterium]
MQDIYRMTDFLESLETSEKDEFLRETEEKATKDSVPIVKRPVRSLLSVLIQIKKPRQILEIGTAVGFSAVFMAKKAPYARITTIENYPPRIKEARKNIPASGEGDRIELLEGDAADILPTLEGPYDLIFMDAAKGQYINFLEDCLRLLSPGGVLVSDNVLQDDDVLRSRYAVKRRNRTIHDRMRDYLYEIKHNEMLETVIIPAADGAAVSVKKEKE